MKKKELTLQSLEKIDPVASAYYKDVARKQRFLSKREEINLLRKYREAKKAIHIAILENKSCIKELREIYEKRKVKGRSIAKMSKSYNNKKTGHNKRITSHLEALMDNLESTEPHHLERKLNLSDEIYSHLETVFNEKEKITPFVEQIREVEDKLVRSALKAAKEIANRYVDVFGIDVKDLIQEANIAILESISRYNPDYRTRQGKRVKFITYAYGTAEKKVREFIMNNSRLIHLPRHRLDQLFLVLEALRLLEHNQHRNTRLVTVLVNLIFSGRKGRLLKDTEMIKETDVVASIETLGNCLRIDQVVNPGGRYATVGDLLPSPEATAEERIEKKDSWDRLEEIITDELEPLEKRVIKLRYLSGGKKLMPYEKILRSLEIMGFDANRLEVAEAEKSGLAKLKEHPEVNELFNKEISDN